MKHSLRSREAVLRTMKRSANVLFLEPQAGFIGSIPASFFMRVSALHLIRSKNEKSTSREVLSFLERITGLEPATSTLARLRSTK